MAEQNKRNLVKMLLLGFVTLGIYWLYWIYKVTQLSSVARSLNCSSACWCPFMTFTGITRPQNVLMS